MTSLLLTQILHSFIMKNKLSKSLIALFLLLSCALLPFTSCTAVGIITTSVASSTLTVADIPDFQDEPVIQINGGVPDFYLSQLKPTAFLEFSALDELGRTGTGFACLGQETLPTEARGTIGAIQPSGWHTIRYDDLIEDRYLYNRCHVIGYMLCADNATPENLFTGTRYLNMTGMLQYESQVAQYILYTGNHVLYRVSPIYVEEELVARGVQMEAYSIEDNGDGICFNVFVYNVQPGIQIDYTTGDSSRSEVTPDETFELIIIDDESTSEDTAIQKLMPETEEYSIGIQETEEQTITYVFNTNTMKFHLPDCPSSTEMKPKNRQDFYGTREEALEKGYTPCSRCNP